MTFSTDKETISVHVNVEMTTDALQAIVANAKQMAGRNEKGYYRVDTAEKVSEMVSRYLLGTDFEGFVSDIDNYRD